MKESTYVILVFIVSITLLISVTAWSLNNINNSKGTFSANFTLKQANETANMNTYQVQVNKNRDDSLQNVKILVNNEVVKQVNPLTDNKLMFEVSVPSVSNSTLVIQWGDMWQSYVESFDIQKINL